MQNMINTVLYLRCKKCKEEKPPEVSIEDYARLEIFFSQSQLKIHCLRHDTTLITIDLKADQDVLDKLFSFKNWQAESPVLH